MLNQLRAYIATQSSGTWSYIKQETLTGMFGWVPSLPGIVLRGVAYRALLDVEGTVAIEQSVRLRHAENIRLGRNVYLDHGVYLHACPDGITIGDDSFLMHGAILHVFNFRDLPHAGITLGQRCFVGERTIIRGQGGVTIGNDVLMAPNVQILAINHVFESSRVPIMHQGIEGKGIVIEDGAWIGAGAIVTDGVRIGRNAVIGAGAVVTSDIPAGTVAVGIPARVVKQIADREPPVDLAPPITELARSTQRKQSSNGLAPAGVEEG